jgi:sugar-specific transcriptional regulator TrmB
MKEYTITVECIETYEVIANSEEEACDKADEMFEKADHTIYIENEEEV